MLEPLVRPRAGQALNAFMAILCVGGIFLEAGVSSGAGEVPAFVIMPVLATFFALRFAGIQAGLWREMKEMPWGYRASSWGALALAMALLGLLGTRGGMIFLAGFAGVDALAALQPYRPGEKKQRDLGRLGETLRKAWLWIGVAWLAGLVGLHFLYAAYVPHGPLLDWTYVVVGFALLLRYGAIGRRAADADAFPPPAHRVHERRDEAIADPVAREAADACNSFLRDGDAGPLLEVVRAVGRHAQLDGRAAADLERRVLGALSRAGTSRHDDLEAAIAALEAAVPSLTMKPVTVPMGEPQ